jgi:hypothetical protein
MGNNSINLVIHQAAACMCVFTSENPVSWRKTVCLGGPTCETTLHADQFEFSHMCPNWYIQITSNNTLWLFNIAMEAMAHRNRWFSWVYLLIAW